MFKSLINKITKKFDSIHIEYSKWYQDKYNGIYYTIGKIKNGHEKLLKEFIYIPTGFGAVIDFHDGNKYFISKIQDMDKADAFISDAFGGLHNGYSLMNLLNKYLA